MNDIISRQAAIKAINDLPNCYNGYSDTYDKAHIIGTLEEVPTIEPKMGKWIEENRRPKSSAFYCSVCHRTAYDPQNHRADVPKRCRYAYCPNCGARMIDC